MLIPPPPSLSCSLFPLVPSSFRVSLPRFLLPPHIRLLSIKDHSHRISPPRFHVPTRIDTRSSCKSPSCQMASPRIRSGQLSSRSYRNLRFDDSLVDDPPTTGGCHQCANHEHERGSQTHRSTHPPQTTNPIASCLTHSRDHLGFLSPQTGPHHPKRLILLYQPLSPQDQLLTLPAPLHHPPPPGQPPSFLNSSSTGEIVNSDGLADRLRRARRSC